LVEGNNVVARIGQRSHDLPPRESELRISMDQDDERPVPLGRVSCFQYVEGEPIRWTMDVVLGYT
jgi:hypothetical protein